MLTLLLYLYLLDSPKSHWDLAGLNDHPTQTLVLTHCTSEARFLSQKSHVLAVLVTGLRCSKADILQQTLQEVLALQKQWQVVHAPFSAKHQVKSRNRAKTRWQTCNFENKSRPNKLKYHFHYASLIKLQVTFEAPLLQQELDTAARHETRDVSTSAKTKRRSPWCYSEIRTS